MRAKDFFDLEQPVLFKDVLVPEVVLYKSRHYLKCIPFEVEKDDYQGSYIKVYNCIDLQNGTHFFIEAEEKVFI